MGTDSGDSEHSRTGLNTLSLVCLRNSLVKNDKIHVIYMEKMIVLKPRSISEGFDNIKPTILPRSIHKFNIIPSPQNPKI